MSNAKINLRKGINRDTRQNIIVLAALVVVMVFFGIRSPYFLKPANLVALLAAAVPLGLIGIAESVCLLTGAFDMAVGMVASLGGVIVRADECVIDGSVRKQLADLHSIILPEN